MMKKILLGLAIAFVVIAAVIFVQTLLSKNGVFGKTATLKVGKQTFHLEVADTPQKRQLGLSNRTSLAQDRGMIFLFDQPEYVSFWMKDMHFPLDMIFVNNTKVVTVDENVPPPSSTNENLPIYQPEEPVNRVIELPAGSAKKYGIKNDDTLSITL